MRHPPWPGILRRDRTGDQQAGQGPAHQPGRLVERCVRTLTVEELTSARVNVHATGCLRFPSRGGRGRLTDDPAGVEEIIPRASRLLMRWSPRDSDSNHSTT